MVSTQNDEGPFRLGAKIVRRDISSVLPLGGRIDLSTGRLSNLKRAQRYGVVFSESDDLHSFHTILSNVLEKFGTKPVHTLKEIRLLKSRFPKQIRLFSGFKDQHMVAGTLIYDFGRVAHTQYLANSNEGRSIGALDLILESVLQTTFSLHHYFSFGISTEDDGRFLNEGLILQKEGFGGRGVIHDVYELHL